MSKDQPSQPESPATAIGIGDRVVHVRSSGRTRGRVAEIHLTATKTWAIVEVDALGGKTMRYDIANLAPEPRQ